MRVPSVAFFALLGLGMVGCSTSQQVSSRGTASADPSTVRAALEAANASFIDAFKRGDKAGMMANYADDVILMEPNAQAWHGREGLSRAIDGMLSQVVLKDGTVTTEDVIVGGDLAVETGAFAWTFEAKTGGGVVRKGKYLTVWKRQPDGSWKILRDINNSNEPAAK